MKWVRRWKYGTRARRTGSWSGVDHMTYAAGGQALKEFRAGCPGLEVHGLACLLAGHRRQRQALPHGSSRSGSCRLMLPLTRLPENRRIARHVRICGVRGTVPRHEGHGGLLRAASLTAVAVAALSAQGTQVADFDGDGTADVLLRIDGVWHVYELDGLEVASGDTEAPDLPGDEAWRVVGAGDLNGDGRDDLLFRHVGGAWHYYAMDGRGAVAEESGAPALPESLDWTFAGIGDLNGDGNDDVLLRHAEGRWLYYAADGRHRVAAGRGLALPESLRWRFAGIGDLNGDGTDDVLLRHEDGRWFYHAVRRGRSVAALSGWTALRDDAGFRFGGIGDLNGDGNDDVLLRGSGGQWRYYAMDGREVVEAESGRAEISSAETWRLAGVGDLDGDGRDDVLLRNADGRWHYQAMDGRRAVAARSGEVGLPRTGSAHGCAEPGSASYVGRVAGFAGPGGDVEVVLTGRGALQAARPGSDGCFAFRDVAPGRYAIKVNAPGHRTTPARVVRFPFAAVHDGLAFDVEELPTDPFVYHWEEDQDTPAGSEYSSHVVEPRVVEFRGGTVDVVDTGAADRLRRDYNVLLAGDGWSQEHAFRLLQTMESIPQPVQHPAHGLTVPASVWRLTDDFIDGDIEVDAAEDGTREVTVSSAAFANAAPRLATVDGKRGVWFSRRLHHAGVRFVTDFGRDVDAYERIFDKRFGLTTEHLDYWHLTGRTLTGHESPHNFQRFEPNEIVLLLNMLEEMPKGMHKVEGFLHLLRRLNGLPHPLYPGAAAVAWPSAGYVEFMEKAFKGSTEDYMHRLILHEKAHMLWANLFDDDLKADWIELGGWYRDPSETSGWSTTKSAEFVSAYAHLKDPNEDMAESISFFVVNPDRLRARSPAKYEFVRDRIMQGRIYLARIREDLTFEVYNLFPDYVYPGKIRRVDVTVAGGPHDDKTLTVDLELHALDGDKEGAIQGFTRLLSSAGTELHFNLYPVDENGEYLDSPSDRARRWSQESTLLRGELTLSRHLKAGYWLPSQFKLEDKAGNERYLRPSSFGWRMYVDNPQEDYTPPEYVRGSVAMSKSVWEEDDTVQIIRVEWSAVEEDSGLEACNANINDTLVGTYSRQTWGDPDGDRCIVDFQMPNYMPSSTYQTQYIQMRDVALNWGTAKFTGDDADEAPATIELVTTNPDTEPPEIDINRIGVDAVPTVPEAPNGETEVTVDLWYRDNISGVAEGRLLLRDPQGGTHSYWLDIPDGGWSLIYPDEDPSEWRHLEHIVILPVGSHPGTWGIAEIVVQDRASNQENYNFVEIVQFEVEGE